MSKAAFRVGEWEQCNDGLFDYWWNVQTDETKWELPAELQHLLPPQALLSQECITGNGFASVSPHDGFRAAAGGSSYVLMDLDDAATHPTAIHMSLPASTEVQMYLQQVEQEKKDRKAEQVRMTRVAQNIAANRNQQQQQQQQQQQVFAPPVFTPSAPAMPAEGPASMVVTPGISANAQDTYPFSMDSKKLGYGRYRSEKYWDLTGKDHGYCISVINGSGGCSSEQLYRKYLRDRGFPTIKAPRMYG